MRVKWTSSPLHVHNNIIVYYYKNTINTENQHMILWSMATLRERYSAPGRDPIIRDYETTAIVCIVNFKRYTVQVVGSQPKRDSTFQSIKLSGRAILNFKP